jgi:hypothetical protein
MGAAGGQALVRDWERERENASVAGDAVSEREMCPWAISKYFGD